MLIALSGTAALVSAGGEGRATSPVPRSLEVRHGPDLGAHLEPVLVVDGDVDAAVHPAGQEQPRGCQGCLWLRGA